MWSAVVFDPALPARSLRASDSLVLSHHAPSGWWPQLLLLTELLEIRAVPLPGRAGRLV
jgi:hypothetical protein